jgi:hypothetical protein
MQRPRADNGREIQLNFVDSLSRNIAPNTLGLQYGDCRACKGWASCLLLLGVVILLRNAAGGRC